MQPLLELVVGCWCAPTFLFDQCPSCDRSITPTALLCCLHSVCEACKATAVAAGPFMDCSLCHRTSNTADLPTLDDYLAQRLARPASQGDLMCQVHNADEAAEPATYFCGTCSFFMCSTCNAEHFQHASFCEHVPELITTLTPEMMRVRVTCPSHGKGQLIIGFCTSCHTSVCPTCITNGHHAHTVVADGLDSTVYLEECRSLDEVLARPLLSHGSVDGVVMTLRTIDELLEAGTANVTTQHAVIEEWARGGTAACTAALTCSVVSWLPSGTCDARL